MLLKIFHIYSHDRTYGLTTRKEEISYIDLSLKIKLADLLSILIDELKFSNFVIPADVLDRIVNQAWVDINWIVNGELVFGFNQKVENRNKEKGEQSYEYQCSSGLLKKIN